MGGGRLPAFGTAVGNMVVGLAWGAWLEAGKERPPSRQSQTGTGGKRKEAPGRVLEALECLRVASPAFIPAWVRAN